MAVSFSKATKRKCKLKLAAAGPAGSGKTWTSLAIASGMGGRIALIAREVWHWCAGYKGPRISEDVWLFPLDGPPLSDLGKLGDGADPVRVHCEVERF